MPQLLLFPDPCPLVERFGREFFLNLPEHPGVYLMRDEAETVLYVGKAKNLRKRLNQYRVANPDRVARRHLRLLRAVRRIDLERCNSEIEALSREAELLLNLRPKFNRVGTYRAPGRFLNWHVSHATVDLRLSNEPEEGFASHPLPKGGIYFHQALSRLLWLATHPRESAAKMPVGWIHGEFRHRAEIALNGFDSHAVAACLEQVLDGETALLIEWLSQRTESSQLETELRESDLELIGNVVGKKA